MTDPSTGSRDTVSVQVMTYRYLRFGLLALLLALTVSVGMATVRDGWQRSISSYYYTPAGPVFIAVLASVGVCLVALHGFTEAENVCLDLAGISAPMVAFVPHPEPGYPPNLPAITNNAVTFLAVLAVGYLVVLVLVWRRLRRGGRLTAWSAVGLVSVAVAWLVGVVWLSVSRTTFVEHAHTLAAVFTFVPFVGVVVLNTDWGVRVVAGDAKRSRTRFDTAYWVLLAVMVSVGVAFGVVHAWKFSVLFVETGMLVCFAAFWILQTIDLWDPVRDAATSVSAGSAPHVGS